MFRKSKNIREIIKDLKNKIDCSLIGILLLSAVFFYISIKGIYIDVINPDGINWHVRSNNFITSLLKHDYGDTYQVYHPGITLMWISAPVLKIMSDYYLKFGLVPYDKIVYLDFDYAAKLSLITVSTLLFLISLLYLRRVLNFTSFIFYSFFMITEPFTLGQRRLYHLDYLMTAFLFTSFISVYYYSFKSRNFFHLIFSCFLFTAALLTKTTAVLYFPILFMIVFFGKLKVATKFVSFLLIIIFTAIFIYIQFPPIWRNPVKYTPKYFEKIVSGITEIGYKGKQEFGYSGKQDSIVLEETVKQFPWYFYFTVALYRLTTGFMVMFGIFLFFLLGNSFLYIVREFKRSLKNIKEKHIKRLFYEETNDDIWLGIFAFIIIDVFFTALSISSKKDERYAVIFMPFLYLMISQGLYRIGKKGAITLILVLSIVLIPQYQEIYPYFHAYANPLLGGVYEKYIQLDSPPFGVATYEIFNSIKEDRNGNTEFFSVSGSKSLKYISAGARFTKAPNCETNYFVAYARSEQPKDVCIGRYDLIKVIKVSNMNYWNIYKHIPKDTVL